MNCVSMELKAMPARMARGLICASLVNHTLVLLLSPTVSPRLSTRTSPAPHALFASGAEKKKEAEQETIAAR